MKYISSETIKAEFKEELKSYFENNLVNDSIFWPVFKKCLDKFSTTYNPEKKDVIEIRNKRAKLPKDFERLCIALICISGETSLTEQWAGVVTEDVKVEELGLCQSSCDVCTDECGNMYQVVRREPDKMITFNTFEVLHLGTTNPSMCLPDCLNFNSNSSYQVQLKDKEIVANFDSGLVYIEYLGSLIEEDEIMFPDNETVNEWIKAELRYKLFSTLYYNGVGDNLTRKREAKIDLHIAAENAKSIIKTSNLKNFYNLSNILIRRYNRLANSVFNERSYSGHINF